VTARLILMCGLPGSGKTTVARRLAVELPAVRLCPDDWMASLEVDLFDERTRDKLERQFWELAQELLTFGQNVILESGFWLRADRDEKRLAARRMGVAVELHFLDVPFEELCARLADREGFGTVSIGPELLRQYVGFFQVPDAEELALFDPCTATVL
jgi:predicted kinase